jgi:hypothetical protein
VSGAAERGRECRTIQPGVARRFAKDFALVAEDRLLAAGLEQGGTSWDPQTGERRGTFAEPTTVFGDRAGESLYASHGRRLARYPTSYDRHDGIVTIGRPVVTPFEHEDARCVDTSRDGGLGLGSFRDKGAWLWRPDPARPPIRLPVQDAWGGALSPDGKWAVVFGGFRDNDQVWDTRTARPVFTFPERAVGLRESFTRSGSFSPDGRWLAVLQEDAPGGCTPSAPGGSSAPSAV